MTGTKRTIRSGVDVLRLGDDEVRIVDIIPGTPARVVVEVLTKSIVSVVKAETPTAHILPLLLPTSPQEAPCSS